MITPHLEKLILCGKAFFKTFVAGGDKCTLNFGNDRFIIITDITYFPMNVTPRSTDDNANTQVAIYGERGYNHFIFRNFNRSNGSHLDFTAPTTINTFIVHDQQVGFSFCNAPFFNNSVAGQAETFNPGYAPPIDFGINGQPGAVATILTQMDTPGVNIITQKLTGRISGGQESKQLLFPFEISSSFGTAINNQYEYPLLHVNYVEVLGSSNNIQI